MGLKRNPNQCSLSPFWLLLIIYLTQELHWDVPKILVYIELSDMNLSAQYHEEPIPVAAILPPSAPQVQRFMVETYSPKWHRPLLTNNHFASKIKSLLGGSSWSSQSPSQSLQQAPAVLEKLTRALLDGIDMLYFPIDVDRGFDDGTDDTQVVYERLAIRDATYCNPTRKTECHSMDGTDMIRNLFLGSFGTSDPKTVFYETLWLPLERMFQTTGENDDDEGTSNNDNDEEKEKLKSVFWAFLDDPTTSTGGGDRLLIPAHGLSWDASITTLRTGWHGISNAGKLPTRIHLPRHQFHLQKNTRRTWDNGSWNSQLIEYTRNK